MTGAAMKARADALLTIAAALSGEYVSDGSDVQSSVQHTRRSANARPPTPSPDRTRSVRARVGASL
jgi:hypothetical protein